MSVSQRSVQPTPSVWMVSTLSPVCVKWARLERCVIKVGDSDIKHELCIYVVLILIKIMRLICGINRGSCITLIFKVPFSCCSFTHFFGI